MLEIDLENLFARTLGADENDDDAWNAVTELRRTGSREVFERAASWLSAKDPERRSSAAQILSQLGKNVEHPETQFAEESYVLLTDLLQHEHEDQVLEALLIGLGHIGKVHAVPNIAEFSEHPAGKVRFAVAFAISCFPDDSRSVLSLIDLTCDSLATVRDWATFGLGVQSVSDSPQIREALLKRVTDLDEDTREEAIVGLAKRKDLRILPALSALLANPGTSVRGCEAVCYLLDLEDTPERWTNADHLAVLFAAVPELKDPGSKGTRVKPSNRG